MKTKSLFVITAYLFFFLVIHTTRAVERQPADSNDNNQNKTPQEKKLSHKTGLILKNEKAFNGYTLFCPTTSTTSFLIDIEGRIVNMWESDYEPGQAVYLLENGHLLRTAFVGPEANHTFHGGGAGGRVQEFTWDGTLVWEFEYKSDAYLLHHDIERLPNGNILTIAWEKKSRLEIHQSGFQ